MQVKRKLGLQSILISNKRDIKGKDHLRNKEGHYIMTKETIQQEDLTIVNIYAPNMVEAKYIKQLLTDIKEKSTGI